MGLKFSLQTTVSSFSPYAPVREAPLKCPLLPLAFCSLFMVLSEQWRSWPVCDLLQFTSLWSSFNLIYLNLLVWSHSQSWPRLQSYCLSGQLALARLLLVWTLTSCTLGEELQCSGLADVSRVHWICESCVHRIISWKEREENCVGSLVEKEKESQVADGICVALAVKCVRDNFESFCFLC